MSPESPETPSPSAYEAPHSNGAPGESSLVEALIRHLSRLGVERAFGVSGGAIALFYDALAESSIGLYHCRHETGAAFAATEAYFASGKPTVVFATTGPGILNAMTGITAAKWDGAKVILISGSTSPGQRGRWATQETSSYTLPQDALYSKGPLFDFAIRMEQVSEFPEIARRLAQGMARPGGFIAHISLPMAIQAGRIEEPASGDRDRDFEAAPPMASRDDIAWCAQLLSQQPFCIWAGFGARHAAPLIHELIARTGAHAFCSPRGKGIIPEDHPKFLGVTGLGGHSQVVDHMVLHKPAWVLVLGTRLGEATSFWDDDMSPLKGFIHVDLDPEIPGTAYPESETIGIHAEIEAFLHGLLEHIPSVSVTHAQEADSGVASDPHSRAPIPPLVPGKRPVRPQVLMHAIQTRIIDRSDAIILSECGNAFAWCNHYLRFPTPGRYRVSTLFGSMGHTAAGVVGAALARNGKAVAVVGDGSMLMTSEISTAVQYQAPAVWIVLNDAGYGMCRDGQRTLGLSDAHVDFPEVDFAGLAASVGADGLRVEYENELETALSHALETVGPFVVDIRIDPNEASPLMRRFESLIRQGTSKRVAGWET